MTPDEAARAWLLTDRNHEEREVGPGAYEALAEVAGDGRYAAILAALRDGAPVHESRRLGTSRVAMIEAFGEMAASVERDRRLDAMRTAHIAKHGGIMCETCGARRPSGILQRDDGSFRCCPECRNFSLLERPQSVAYHSGWDHPPEHAAAPPFEETPHGAFAGLMFRYKTGGPALHACLRAQAGGHGLMGRCARANLAPYNQIQKGWHCTWCGRAYDGDHDEWRLTSDGRPVCSAPCHWKLCARATDGRHHYIDGTCSECFRTVNASKYL